MSVTIHTATGSREISTFRVRQDASPRALRAEKRRDTSSRAFFGDRGRNPSALVIDVEVQEATISATRNLVGGILSDAQAATLVETPRGVRVVNGITTHRATFNRRAVTLSLSFAPENGSYWPPTLGLRGDYRFDAGSGSTLVDASAFGHDATITGATWTSAGLSFDGSDDYAEPPAALAPSGDVTMILALKFREPTTTNPNYMAFKYESGSSMRFIWHANTELMSFRTHDGTNTTLTDHPQVLDVDDVAVYCATYRRSDSLVQIARDGGAFTSQTGRVVGSAPERAVFGASEFLTSHANCELYASVVYSHRLTEAEWGDAYAVISRMLASRGAT